MWAQRSCFSLRSPANRLACVRDDRSKETRCRTEEGAHVRVFGTGRKERRVPLTKLTATVLEDWLQEPVRCKAKTLFPNARGGRLTADGVRYFLNTHIGAASDTCPSLQDKQVTPYILDTPQPCNCSRPAWIEKRSHTGWVLSPLLACDRTSMHISHLRKS